MKPFKNLIDCIKFIIASMLKSYRDIFKAGIFLCGVAVAGLSQTYIELIQMDYEARELQFVLEAQENKKISNIDCTTISDKKAECLLVKFKLKSNFQIYNIAAITITVFGIAGYFLVIVSAAGFLSHAREKKKREETPKITK